MATRMKTVGNVLVTAGAVVGAGTITAIAAGYEIRLTPEMVELLIYKAFGAAAIGLMVVGTFIGRSSNHRRDDVDAGLQHKPEDIPGQMEAPALRPGPPPHPDLHAAQGRDHVSKRIIETPDFRAK